MEYIDNFLFAILLVFGIGFFIKNLKKLKRNINLGKDIDRSDRIGQRWNNMFRIYPVATFRESWRGLD